MRAPVKSAADIGADQHRAFEVRVAKHGAGQIRTAQIGILQYGCAQVCALKLAARQQRACKLRAVELCSAKYGVRAIGIRELRLDERGGNQARFRQPDTREIGAREIGP